MTLTVLLLLHYSKNRRQRFGDNETERGTSRAKKSKLCVHVVQVLDLTVDRADS